MTEPSRNTVLQLAPGIRTRFDVGGRVLLDAPDGTIVNLGPHGYRVLSLFTLPIALGEAVDRLGRDGTKGTDLAPTLNALNVLIEEGALVRPGPGSVPASGWADPVEQARMLHDDRRTGAYLAALAAAVRPGDVVLDLGTGSGVLAVAAARAGARHVYAVEASDIAEVAGRVFAANHVDDRVTLLPGWSREIVLPEPADVLVAEIIGNEPFEEEILESTLDARRRLLAPGARLIPRTLTVLARPLLIPDREARQRTVGSAGVARWRDLYGIEFQPLLDAAGARPALSPVEGEVASQWPVVGPTTVLTSVDLARFEHAAVRADADLVVPGGSVNAVALTFRAQLHGAICHTLDPWTWPESSWATSVWVLPETVSVRQDEVLSVRYSRRVPEARDGLTAEVVAATRGRRPGESSAPGEALPRPRCAQ